MKIRKSAARAGIAAGLAAGMLGYGSVAAEPGDTALFNGRDLSGWNFLLVEPDAKMEDVWSVKDGLLVCRGEPMGYLFTRDTFKNFRMTVEWRWAPGGNPGNSGVLLRINGGQRGLLPRCLESQLKSGDAGALYGFHGMGIGGPGERFVHIPEHKIGGELRGVKKIKGAENPPGEWNTMEIVLNGSALTVSVNGHKVNEATDCEIVPGPVGLQSEGGEIHFRSVRIAPMP